MKKCPFCGATQADDNVFCTECGKRIPQVNKCPHCGADINEGDAFCQNCGKSINEPLDSNSIICEGEKKSSFIHFLPYIICAILLLIFIGYYFSHGISKESVETLVTDSISTSACDEDTEQVINAKIDFLETFYKNKDFEDQALEYAYIKKNVTANGLNDLKELYDYDCDGECLATWVFDYDSGSDNGDLKTSKITSVGGNDFLVEKDYEYARYCVLLTVVKDGNAFKIDKIEPKESSYSPKQDETESLDWLQGHWVYEHGNYKAHIIIDGDKVIQYSTMNPEKYEKTYTIDGNELHANLIDGMDWVIKIDFENQRIDYGDGQWMHKISSDSNGSKSGSAYSLDTRYRPFSSEQDVMARLYNQRFRHTSGLEIRIDGDGRIEIDGNPAGVLSVIRFNSESALLHYGGGMYNEGKMTFKNDGSKQYLQDTADGSIFYQQ